MKRCGIFTDFAHDGFYYKQVKIRHKLLLLMVIIPFLCLGIFSYFAISSFIRDKKLTALDHQFELLNIASLQFEQTQTQDEFLQALDRIQQQEGFENLIVSTISGRDFKNENHSIQPQIGEDAFQKLLQLKGTEGSFTSIGFNGEFNLVSYMKLRREPSAILVLFTPQSSITRATYLFLLKASAFLLGLLSFAVLASFFFSNKLTHELRILSNALVLFGKGDFEKSLPKFESQDEVADMARRFEIMRLQIKDFIVEQRQKAKLDFEMKIAGEFQKAFFPQSDFKYKGVEFSGYFEPAEKIGGDFWTYFIVPNEAEGDQFVFFIGDLTGHGLKAAMLTGAVKASLTIASSNFQGVTETMSSLNRVISESSNGTLNMTGFLGSLNTKTGVVDYVLASHEPPIHIPMGLKRGFDIKNFQFLLENPDPRLGESLSSVYHHYAFQLQPGETLIAYSDGVTAAQSANEKQLGERKLLKSLSANYSDKHTAKETNTSIKICISEHRSKNPPPLQDDLSYFVIRWVP